MSLLEAMAAGVPVAVTDVGECRHVIDNGRCGVLFPEGESTWASCLAGMLRGRESQAQRESVESGIERVRELFSLASTLESYEQAYALARASISCSRGITQ